MYQYLMEMQELKNMAAKQAAPTTSKDDIEDELVFKTAPNSPEKANKFIKSIVTLVDKFMADITGYDRYKQEEAYPEFVQKYVKELQNLDNYFKDTSPSIILEIVDDKMCEYILCHRDGGRSQGDTRHSMLLARRQGGFNFDE